MSTTASFARAHKTFVKLSDVTSGVDCGGAQSQRQGDQVVSPRSTEHDTSPRLSPQQEPPCRSSSGSSSSCPVVLPTNSKEAFHPLTQLPLELYSQPGASTGAAEGVSGGVVSSGSITHKQPRSWGWWPKPASPDVAPPPTPQPAATGQGQGAPSSPDTSPALGVSRQRSSIPMAAPPDTLPAHQQLPQGSGGQQAEQVWMYPSEQMFYNAMQRKGWQPAAQDMSTVVAIHNSVNERAWAEVKAWEALHCADCPQGPRLVRFQGRPADLSPKARLLNALGYALPFDRHDWVVDRCGHQVRYVIDFYAGVPQPGGPPAAMFLDTRPALDSFGAAWDRIVMQARWMTRGMWQ